MLKPVFVFIILATIAHEQQAFCTQVEATPRERSEGMFLDTHNPKLLAPKQVTSEAKENDLGARVRIAFLLTPYREIEVKLPSNQTVKKMVPAEPLRHTLRARINKLNHFFVGDWHFETIPLRLIRQTQKFSIRINAYHRYGTDGEVEEDVGSIELTGILKKTRDGLYVLYGSAEKMLTSKDGTALAKLAVGYAGPDQPVISRK